MICRVSIEVLHPAVADRKRLLLTQDQADHTTQLKLPVSTHVDAGRVLLTIFLRRVTGISAKVNKRRDLALKGLSRSHKYWNWEVNTARRGPRNLMTAVKEPPSLCHPAHGLRKKGFKTCDYFLSLHLLLFLQLILTYPD